jgi:hypothetical protein
MNGLSFEAKSSKKSRRVLRGIREDIILSPESRDSSSGGAAAGNETTLTPSGWQNSRPNGSEVSLMNP